MSDHALFLTKAYASQSLEVKPITRLLPQPEDTLVQKPSYFMTVHAFCCLLVAFSSHPAQFYLVLSWDLWGLSAVCGCLHAVCFVLVSVTCHTSGSYFLLRIVDKDVHVDLNNQN